MKKKKEQKPGYYIFLEDLGAKSWVEGEVTEIQGVKCGITLDKDNDYVITELSTGGLICYEQDKETAIKIACVRIASHLYGPAIERARAFLDLHKIEYPLNAV